MRYSWSTFLLLTVVAVTKSNVLQDVVERLTGAKNNYCANNYKNDPALFPELHGYRYNLYTTLRSSLNNEVVKYDPIGNSSIFARTTIDGECCKTLHITLGKEYNVYDIATDADCSTKLFDVSGQTKLIASNVADDGSRCLILWNCRKSRKAVHALCDKRAVSQAQSKWIRMQFDQMKLTATEVEQTADYSGEKCFKHQIIKK